MSIVFAISVFFATAVGVSMVIWFVSSGLRDYQLDLHRQSLFKIRSNLFDLAIKREISFEDDAYGIVRGTLNGSINFLNDLSVFRFVMFLYFSRGVEKTNLMTTYLSRREQAFAKLSKKEKDIYEATVKEMHYTIFSFMIQSSILLNLALRVLVLFLSLNKVAVFAFSNAKIQRRFEVMDTEASVLASA